jgi:predicted nuclease with TOPRIM domain
VDELRRCKEGDSSLDEFRKLLQELTQEKMSHVEELRQINSDINTIEEAIKQAESDRLRATENARRLLNETMRLKDQANLLGRNAGATEILVDPVIPHEELAKSVHTFSHYEG